MGKENWIQHIALMLKYLDDEDIQALYMIIKRMYILSQPSKE